MMNLFRLLPGSSLLSTGQSVRETSPETGQDTVERLADRFRTSMMLRDKRDACRGLHALASTYRLVVGAQCLPDMMSALRSGRKDSSICTSIVDAELFSYILNTAIILLSNPLGESLEQQEPAVEQDVSLQFADIIIKHPDNILSILDCIDEDAFRLRFPAVRLLTCLLSMRTRYLQNIIVQSGMGVAKLVDVLDDPREMIRNEALIMLTYLTKNNSNIQKIVAFENAFARVFSVIETQGGCHGDIVVEDCLRLITSLFVNNPCNQMLFVETRQMERVCKLIAACESDPHADSYTQQIFTNYMCTFDLICEICAAAVCTTAGEPCTTTAAVRDLIVSCGLLDLLLVLAFGTSCHALRIQTHPGTYTRLLMSISSCVWGHRSAQEAMGRFLAARNIADSQTQTMLLLLQRLFHASKSASVQYGWLSTIQALMSGDVVCQMTLIQLMFGDTGVCEVDETIGQRMRAYFCVQHSHARDNSPFECWIVSMLLMHALHDNSAACDIVHQQSLQCCCCQTELGGSQPRDTSSTAHPAASMLDCVCHICVHECSYAHLAKVALLQLLVTWAHHSTAVAQRLLDDGSRLLATREEGALTHALSAFLLGVCALSSRPETARMRSFEQLIRRRMCRIDDYMEAIGRATRPVDTDAVYQHEVRVSKHWPLDEHFVRRYKRIEYDIVNLVRDNTGVQCETTTVELELRSMIEKYRTIISEQSEKIEALEKFSETGASQPVCESAEINQAERGTEGNSRNSGADTIDTVLSQVEKLRTENDILCRQLNESKQEQEGLLILLADMEDKLSELTNGETV